METNEERYERWLKQNGYWFASTTEMDVWAKRHPNLKPISELIPDYPEHCCTYVYKHFTVNDLTSIFKIEWLKNACKMIVFGYGSDYEI